MSSKEEHPSAFDEAHSASAPRPATAEPAVPAVGDGPIPSWLIGLIFVGLFWSGAYLFSYSGGFNADVFDYLPKFGAIASGPQAPPDPKVIGKALFSANCITCHQATGQGLPGQYPPLVGSEYVLGDATNHLIAIVLKGLQGPVQVKGQSFNNAMQPWEGQYTDAQLAAILTYVRSDWGNNAPPIPAEAVKQMREELKDRKDQWTMAELMKIPGKDVTKAQSSQQAANKPPAGTPQPGNQGTQPQGGNPPQSQPSPSPAGSPASQQQT